MSEEFQDYYELKCPHCDKTFRYTDERPDGYIDCLYCDEEIELELDKES